MCMYLMEALLFSMKIVYFHIWHSSSFNWSNLDSRWPSRVGKTRPATEIADFGSTSCHTTSSFGCRCWLHREVFNSTFGFWLSHSWIWHLLSMQSIEHRFCFTQGCSFFWTNIWSVISIVRSFLRSVLFYLFYSLLSCLCLWMSIICSFFWSDVLYKESNWKKLPFAKHSILFLQLL